MKNKLKKSKNICIICKEEIRGLGAHVNKGYCCADKGCLEQALLLQDMDMRTEEIADRLNNGFRTV